MEERRDGRKGEWREGQTSVHSEQGEGFPPASPRKSHREVVEEEVGEGDPSLQCHQRLGCGLPVVATLEAAADGWLGRSVDWEHTEPSTAEMTSPHSNAFSSRWMQLMVLPVRGEKQVFRIL